MSFRLAGAGIAAALSLVACGVTPPTAAPAATSQTASTAPGLSPSGTLPASLPASLSASAAGTLGIDDPAYLAGDAFSLSVGEAGADWTVPSLAPIMPNGQPAMRVAFLPVSCATGDFTITTDAAPEDAWETSLRAVGDSHPYEMGFWPAAQVPECANGQGRTYLQVGYHPLVALGTIHLVASLTNVTDAPAAVDMLPVFTSADATQPSLTMVGFIAFESVPGPEKPRSASAQEMSTYDFARTTLPDGTTPTHWGFVVTGCGPVGQGSIVITARVGSAAPVEVGTCSDGSLLSGEMSLPLPVDGTQVAVLMAGGTTKTHVRVSEFQWRGDRS